MQHIYQTQLWLVQVLRLQIETKRHLTSLELGLQER